MKRVFVLGFIVSVLMSCDPVDGNLTGVKGRDTFYPDILDPGKVPYGMVYVPGGGFKAGQDEEEVFNLQTARKRDVSVQAFYMDASEISNNEYRQFVNWVRDSIAREKLYRRQSGEDAEQWVNVPDAFFKEPYRTVMAMGSDLQGGNTPFESFIDTTGQKELDLLFLNTTGYQGQKNKKFNKVSLKNSQKQAFDRKNVELVMNSEEIEDIFAAYDKKNGSKIDDQTPDAKANANFKDNLKTNGGRIENRKYFTLNWEVPIDYTDDEVVYLLSDMYLPKSEEYYNGKQIDTRLLFFDYYWIDYKEAAKRGNVQTIENAYTETINSLSDGTRRNPMGKDQKNPLHRSTLTPDGNSVLYDGTNIDLEAKPNNVNVVDTFLMNPGQDMDLGFSNSKGQHNAIRGHSDRSRFIIKEKINVYPDTLCWVRDWTYSFHDAMTKNYFWHTAYDNYPVVGVTWSQAKAFSVWRTQLFHSWLQANGDLYVNDFRLPTEMEWEKAARGDLNSSPYPWGGYYIRNTAGCFLANFKPMRGRYMEDGGFHTVKVYSYNPNGYGLYCMSGNVAEWCNTAYHESMMEVAHDLNMDYTYDAKDEEPAVRKRKVIRGGSFKDIGWYLTTAARSYEYQDTAKCYIGFRNVMTHLGRGGRDLDAENGEEIQNDIQLK